MRKWDRPVYKLWEEGRVPSLVVEVTSESTRDEDLSKKKGIYQRLSTTGLIFRPEGGRLRLVDPAAGPLLWMEEIEQELDRLLRAEHERRHG